MWKIQPKTDYPKIVGQFQRGAICAVGIPEDEAESCAKETSAIIWPTVFQNEQQTLNHRPREVREHQAQ